MKNYTRFIAVLAASFVLTWTLSACGGQEKKSAESVSDSIATLGQDVTKGGVVGEGKHTEAYIKERLNVIYSNFSYEKFTSGDAIHFLDYDSLYCSCAYLQLQRAALENGDVMGVLVIDSDHWIMGQDMAPDWSYSIVGVSEITDSTAVADMKIMNFSEQLFTLKLRFERGDWYVDDFVNSYVDDEGNVIYYTETENLRYFANNGSVG